MALSIVVRSRAVEDISAQVAYYKRERSADVAQTFYRAAVKTLAGLAEMPGIGVRIPSAAVPDLRRWRVTGFESILLFYRFDADRLYLIRVLHGARDLDNLLGDEKEFGD